MSRQKGKGEFREKEALFSVPMRKGEELRFSVVEVEGKTRADIRYFSQVEDGMRPTPRGIMVDPVKLTEIESGIRKLVDRFSKK
ncbi:MAG TPA: PC4/YdbC family ssDNA-binding protein [Candidatus Omnitrophota bacterium]|nr:PC4/YdbC family ssDNA-binding protein [Candidatus Omnitrophota bacterium]